MSPLLVTAGLQAAGSILGGLSARNNANNQAWANYYNTVIRYGQEQQELQQEAFQDRDRTAEQLFDVTIQAVEMASAARVSSAERGTLGLSQDALVQDAFRQGGRADTRISTNFGAREEQRRQDRVNSYMNAAMSIQQGNYVARQQRRNAIFSSLGGFATAFGGAYANSRLRIPTK